MDLSDLSWGIFLLFRRQSCVISNILCQVFWTESWTVSIWIYLLGNALQTLAVIGLNNVIGFLLLG